MPKLQRAGAFAGVTADQEAAVSAVLDITTPRVGEMIEVLIAIAHTAKRDGLRERAAAKVIELHLRAVEAQSGAKNDPQAGRVVVIQSSTLDQIEALHRGAASAIASGDK